MEKTILNSMFDNLLHIWNKTNFWNTKMKPYIYGSVNWIHVINLIETSKKLDEIKSQLSQISTEWKKILFVATKIQSRDAFKKLAVDTWHLYVTEKWVPGLLTNFKTIKKRISSYLELLKDSQNWALEVLTKKEKASKMLELEKLDKAYSWLKEMKKLPDVIFASDWIYEKLALKEAIILNIKSLAIFNTNWDIDLVSNMIPANTNSVKSFDYLAWELKIWLQTIPQKKKEKIKKVVEKEVKEEIKEEKKKETKPKKVIEKEVKKPSAKKSVSKKETV